MSIAHNQIKDDFKPINQTPEKEVLKKLMGWLLLWDGTRHVKMKQYVYQCT